MKVNRMDVMRVRKTQQDDNGKIKNPENVSLAGFAEICDVFSDDDGIRTHTFFRTPAPQAGKSTNFSTSPKQKKPD